MQYPTNYAAAVSVTYEYLSDLYRYLRSYFVYHYSSLIVFNPVHITQYLRIKITINFTKS